MRALLALFLLFAVPAASAEPVCLGGGCVDVLLIEPSERCDGSEGRADAYGRVWLSLAVADRVGMLEVESECHSEGQRSALGVAASFLQPSTGGGVDVEVDWTGEDGACAIETRNRDATGDLPCPTAPPTLVHDLLP